MLAILPSILHWVAEVEGASMDGLIKTVLDSARYLRERDVDAGGDYMGRDQDELYG